MGGVISSHFEYVNLKKYLDNGGDPNAYTDNESQFLIHVQNTACVKLLLERGANPNQNIRPWNTVWTPLVFIITHLIKNKTEMVKLLLQHGADVHLENPILYMDMIDYSQREILVTLLKYGADINSKDAWGLTLFDRWLRRYNFVEFQTKALDNLIFLAKCGSRIDIKKFSKELPIIQPLVKIWARRKWAVIKCAVKILGLQQRAVVTANHPLRKLARGEFNDDE